MSPSAVWHAWKELVLQTWGTGPVNTWPAALTVWFDRIQASGLLTPVYTVMLLLLVICSPSIFAGLSATMLRTGVIRCGRTSGARAAGRARRRARGAAPP